MRPMPYFVSPTRSKKNEKVNTVKPRLMQGPEIREISQVGTEIN